MSESNKKETVDAWIKEVDKWINHRGWKNEQAYKRGGDNPSIDIFIEKLRSAVKKNNAEQAWKYIRRLKRLVDEEGYNKAVMNQIRKDRRPEIVLQCALAAYNLQDIREAKNFLRDAGGKFPPYSWERVFSLWLQGCFLWVPPSKVGEAIFYWEESLGKLREINRRKTLEGKQLEWFLSRKSEMKEAIKVAAKKEYPPFPSEVRSNIPDKQPSTKALAFSIPVLGEIPAGHPAEIFPETDSSLEFRDIYLDDSRFEAFSVTDKNIIELNSLTDYYVLRVKGDSMNKSEPINILNGNYVLLKKQGSAKNGDIVAVDIIGLDDRATLKRYRKKGNSIFFLPESNSNDFQNPIYMEREFSQLDVEFVIRGVVVAVLKKHQINSSLFPLY